ncbi:MAG: hypothetical protein ABH825_02815, partial [Candidatus Omnitrophota bacterium]
QQISTEIADVVLDNWTADNSRIPGDLAIARRFNRADISPQVIGALTEQCYRYLAGGDFSDLDPEFKAVGSLLREWGVSYSDILAGQQAASYGLKNRNEIFDQI